MLIILLVVMSLLSAVTSIQEIPANESQMKCISNNIQTASQWLKDNDPQYHDKIIYSERWPQFSWYLRTNVRQMPSFSTRKLYENQLNRDKVDYYISFKKCLT
jgi:hypothetical protein